jgi:hypothetical protein
MVQAQFFECHSFFLNFMFWIVVTNLSAQQNFTVKSEIACRNYASLHKK